MIVEESVTVAQLKKTRPKRVITLILIIFFSVIFVGLYKEKTSVEKIVKKLGKLIRGIVLSVSFDSLGNPQFSFSWIEGNNKEATLEDVINLPENLADKQQQWIVAFDEFQEITKLNGESFEKILRSLFNITKMFLIFF